MEKFRVMSPGGRSSVGDAPSFNSAPKFITNETSKTRYRDDLRRWIKILGQIASSDNKYKGMLTVAGSLIYWSCDVHAQDMLKKAEISGLFTLDGSEDDPMRIKLVDNIINITPRPSCISIFRAVVFVCDFESEERR